MHRCRPARAVLLALAATTAVPLRVRGAIMPLATVRPYDPVVVQTGRLPRLPDRDPAHYRLYVMRGTRLVPIPFQVDARDVQGRYVFDRMLGGVGEPFGDDDDELVFIAKDTGPRIAPACLPDDPSATEIEVRDPGTGARGDAYLVRDPNGPQPAEPPYAVSDPARGEVRAQSYRLQYPPGRNFFTRLQVTHGDGARSEALIDRMSLRIHPTFSLLRMEWSPELTEESFVTTIDGVRNGPVRSIVRARQSLDLGRMLPDPPAGVHDRQRPHSARRNAHEHQ